MTVEERYAFETNGYLVRKDALGDAELKRLNRALDRDFGERPDSFYSRSEGTWQSVRVMEQETDFDDLIRHPNTFDLLRGLMDDDIAFSELSVIIKGPRSATHARWHTDVGYQGVPLQQSLLLISCIYYLSDVPEDGACFTVVPGSHKFEREQPAVDDPDDMPGRVKLSGQAGTAIIFNANLWHAAISENAGLDRRTVHVYYCRPWMKPSGHTQFPLRMLETADTPFLRKFYHENWGIAK